MKKRVKTGWLLAAVIFPGIILQVSCSSSAGGYGRSNVTYGVGYRSYYGHPWSGYRSPPVYVIDGGGIDPGGPVAVPLHDMGPPDFGGPGMDSMDMDMGFDW